MLHSGDTRLQYGIRQRLEQEKSGILDVKFTSLMPLESLENYGRKIDCWSSQQDGSGPNLIKKNFSWKDSLK